MQPRFTRTRALLSTGLLAGVLVTGALAAFTDTATTEGDFTTGSVELTLDPTTDLFSVTNLAPGDVVYAPLQVSNSGSLDFTYGVTTVTTNTDGKGLAAALNAEVRSGASGCDAAGFASGALVSASSDLSGVSASGRSLAAGAGETWCFRVELPDTAGNGLQDATTSATFTFTADQA